MGIVPYEDGETRGPAWKPAPTGTREHLGSGMLKRRDDVGIVPCEDADLFRFLTGTCPWGGRGPPLDSPGTQDDERKII